MRYNKRGFSLVELLAVVVILGILSIVTIVSYNRYIKSARNQANKQLEKNAIMATKSYLQANKQYQPKNVGDVQNIYLEDLINNNYLKESDFTCEDGKKCDHNNIDVRNAYVIVSKESNSNFNYEVVLETKEGNSTFPSIKKIGSGFEGDDNSSLIFKANILADENNINSNKYFVANYSYIIYVCLKDKKEEPCLPSEYREVYNSGFKSGSKESNVSLNIDISKYIKISKVNNVKLRIVATNSIGNTRSNDFDKQNLDEKGPICSIINPVDSRDKLTKEDLLKGKKRVITVDCIDTGGSKCKKKKYTKIWDKDTVISDKDAFYNFNINDNKNHQKGIIVIEDNAGLSADCEVDINIDLSEPDNDNEGPIIKLYADNGSGGHGFSEKTFNGQKKGDNNYVINYSDYETQTEDDSSKDLANANEWLNKAWYPRGISYYTTITDDSGIKKVTWSTNSNKLKADDKKLKILTATAPYTPTSHASLFSNNNKVFTKSWGIEGEGVRYATIVAEDNKGNKTTIEVNSKIDHTPPSIPTANIRRYNAAGEVLVNKPNPSNTHNYITNMWWGDFSGSDSMSGSRKYEYAVANKKDCSNPVYTGETNSAGYTKPNPGYISHHSCYMLRQLDNAGNYSERKVNNNTTSWSEGYRMDIEKPNFKYKDTFPDWKVIYNTPGVTRNYCDKWSGKPNILGTCPNGVYANIVGRVNASYSNGNVTFDWYIANGGETWIGSGYYVELVILPYSSTPNYDSSDVKECSDYSSSKVTACEYLKESSSDAWLPGSSNSGKSTISLSKGSYDVYFAGNSETPSYTQYMGWIEIN